MRSNLRSLYGKKSTFKNYSLGKLINLKTNSQETFIFHERRLWSSIEGVDHHSLSVQLCAEVEPL